MVSSRFPRIPRLVREPLEWTIQWIAYGNEALHLLRRHKNALLARLEIDHARP